MKNETKIIIYVVDDDPSVRDALEMLLISAGMDVQTFVNAEDFLKHEINVKNTCLVSDVKMAGLDGLALQRRLIEDGINVPVIFLTAYDSSESRLKAKQAGAAGFFRKPVDDQALLDTIQWALSRNTAPE